VVIISGILQKKQKQGSFMMLKQSILITLLASTLLFQACGEKQKKENTQTEVTNKKVNSNEYTLISTENKSFVIKKESEGFTLQEATGKVIIFDIFATWCPPCQASALHLTSLQEKFKNEVIVIGVTIESDITNAELTNFKEKHNAKYAIVNSEDNRRFINDVADALGLGERFPIPIMAMYKDGKLINHYIGEVHEEFVESDIQRALGK
jgi:thiol-disulfide isomerase/thioredoxin